MNAVQALKQVYFLEHLTPEEFQALADMMDLRPFVAGDKILNQAEPTTNFYIVDSGYVNLRSTDRSGNERPIGSKGPGDYFGVKMFTTQEAAEYTFEAVGQAEMWVVERRDWDALLGKFPDMLDHMPELRVEYEKLTRGLDWLAPGEVIGIMTRRHWWALFLMIRLPVFVALLFTVAFFLSQRFQVVQALSWVVFVYLGVIIVSLVWLAWNALNWWNDMYIITNKRAVRINQVLFFSDSREEIAIEKIQSQKVERGGPISVFLNISDLRLTSAASDSGLVFEQVAHVEEIQRAIEGEKSKVVERRGASERERLRNQIAGEIRHYVFQQPNPPEKPKPVVKPLTMQKRLHMVWQSLFGTEIRDGKIVTWRKHPVVLLQQTGIYLAAFLLLLAITIGISVYGTALQLAQNGVYFAMGALMLIAFGFVVWQWLDWQRDLYRLTETQIIDIESLPFGLRYTEQKADLSKIQDVNSARPRFFNTLLDYGDVITRVAGNADPFTFISVAHPRVVADEISERILTLKLRETERNTRDQTRTIVDAIVAYHRLMMAERQQLAHASPQPTITIAQSAAPPTDDSNGDSALMIPENVVETPARSADLPPPASNPAQEFPPED